MKRNPLIAILIWLICLSSCSYRFRGAYGQIGADKVEEICNSYCERKDIDWFYKKSVFIRADLGLYHDHVYVDILELELIGGHQELWSKVELVNGKYICSTLNGETDVNVYVDGDKSYSLSKAFDNGLITDSDLDEIIEKSKATIYYDSEAASNFASQNK